jgi:pyridinium-3,5-biscarboxylic acid mononucleotide sulfurtransferase
MDQWMARSIRNDAMNDTLKLFYRSGQLDDRWKQLQDWLRKNHPVAIAVSGGIDSITLATAGCRWGDCEMFHAVSPAVPPEATARVKRLANDQGWRLTIFDAGEFEDSDYRTNPVNRCFHCKTNLYGSIRRQTDLLIISGTNLDDLGEFRPGLEAATTFGVRHPYVETGINKIRVRALARRLGLGSLAELPAAPCLSSRVETGIRIEPAALRVIHLVEQLVNRSHACRSVRCRLRGHGIVIELDKSALDELLPETAAKLGEEVAGLFAEVGIRLPVSFAPYRTGSAFLRQPL